MIINFNRRLSVFFSGVGLTQPSDVDSTTPGDLVDITLNNTRFINVFDNTGVVDVVNPQFNTYLISILDSTAPTDSLFNLQTDSLRITDHTTPTDNAVISLV